MNLKIPSDRCMLLRNLLTCWYGSGGQVYIDKIFLHTSLLYMYLIIIMCVLSSSMLKYIFCIIVSKINYQTVSLPACEG